MCRANAEALEGGMAHLGRVLLPTNVKPIHYDLTMEPNFEKFTFEGTVVTDLEVIEDTTSISNNTLDLEIHSTTISADGQQITSSPAVSYDKDTQTTTASFEETIPAGSKAQIRQTFTGSLNDQMVGFYRSSFLDSDGNKQWIATTQMEATDARRAFPCWDEPSLKATFTMTLIADKHHTCLSNMDEASEKEVDSKITGSNRKAVTFNKTPLMSTYLLAFIIGELKCIETDKFRLPVRVFVTPDEDVEHGRFSLELAAKTLDFYEKTFDSKFPLPKMDMVAIPDFSAGAMENWGLITYRKVLVLYDEKTGNASSRERIAEVVQHELAHQWFGNLVTMDFWDGLWLNEGFATWMSWYSCNNFFPEWKVWESYVASTLQQALGLDALRSSHPVEVPVKRAEEINEIFDSISYSKGSCVIRMVSKYLGEDVFMEGIRRYLNKHAYGNTETTDLWAALSDVSGKPVEEVMAIWTKKIGYPVVTVTESEKSNSIYLKQNRFLKTGDVKPDDDETLYPVALGLRTGKGSEHKNIVLSDREVSIDVPSLEFFKLNADHSGFYRTSYSPARLEKLGIAAGKGLLGVEDRVGLIADAGALAAAGSQKTSGVLSLLKSFGQEPEFVVWSQLLSELGGIGAAWVFEDEEVREGLKAFQRNLVAPLAQKKGWIFSDSDDHIEGQFKALLFAGAGSAHDPEVVKAAQTMFEKFASGDRKAINPNIRGSVYGLALSNGGEKEWDVLFNDYKSTKDSSERISALQSLGRTKNEKLIERDLTLPLSDDVKPQDLYYPIAHLRETPQGINALWQWLTTNWEGIKVKAPPTLTMLGTIVKICTTSFTKQEQLEQVQAFFKGKDLKGFKRSLEQALDSSRAKISWVERDREDVRAWLEKEGYLDTKAAEKL